MVDKSPKTNTVSRKIVLVTGPSGAGRSTAIHALEDLGFETIDNLPLTLLPRLLTGPPMRQNLALGVDVRNRDFSADSLIAAVDIIDAETDFDCTLIYLECAESALVRRYSETRRRHPMAFNETPLEGIGREVSLLGGLKERADILIETTDMSPHDLKAELSGWFEAEGATKMAVSVQSFSYKRGIPRGADMVLDCRFLRNPHWEKALRKLDGRAAAVGEYIKADPRFEAFFTQTQNLLQTLLPGYRDEGKSYFTVAMGCTGGQHRSVFLTEALANALAQTDWQVSIRHREIERRALGVAAKK